MNESIKDQKTIQNTSGTCYTNHASADPEHDARIEALVRLIARRAAECDYQELLAALETDKRSSEAPQITTAIQEKAD